MSFLSASLKKLTCYSRVKAPFHQWWKKPFHQTTEVSPKVRKLYPANWSSKVLYFSAWLDKFQFSTYISSFFLPYPKVGEKPFSLIRALSDGLGTTYNLEEHFWWHRTWRDKAIVGERREDTLETRWEI